MIFIYCINYNKLLLHAVIIIAFIACRQSPDNLEQSLYFAGTNRSELEKVLLHYRQNPADSLKYRAAVFLISNMPGHYSYADGSLERYYDALDSISYRYADVGWKDEEAQEALKGYAQRGFRLPPVVSDLQVIKAGYLTDNIERSFDLWKNCCWLENLSFDDFCESILPYKVCETQTLDNWKEYLASEAYGDLQYLSYTDCSPLSACEKVNGALSEKYPSKQIDIKSPRIGRIKTLLSSLKTRDCYDDSYAATAVMRAKGIPAVIDFIPQWPQSQTNHAWCLLINNTSKNIPFDGFSGRVGTTFYSTISKVYRKTYAVNPDILKLNQSGEQVPLLFRNLCMKDVTEAYTRTVDITVSLEKCENKYAYLCTFNGYEWNPVACGTIRGGKAHFKNVGCQVVYTPAVFDDKGFRAIGSSFVLNHQGKMKPVIPHLTKRQSMKLYRKYPAKWWLDMYAHRTIGGKFQAARKADFSDAVTIATISKFGTESDEFIVHTKEKYRYWRYLSAPEGWGHLSEVYYISNGENIAKKGEVLGIRGTGKDRQPENLYDNDPLTCYEAPAPSGCWSGLDFGEPVAIERILYAPRADGNCVTYGDEYELKYWNNQAWVSLGRQTAGSIHLTFDNCPTGALFLLHDLTRGVEDRIFMYENGKQVWW